MIITGHIRDTKGQLLPGQAHVINHTDGRVLVADRQGQWIINAEPSDHLEFRHIGFKSEHRKALVADHSVVELEEANNLLDQVTVTPDTTEPQVQKNNRWPVGLIWAAGASLLLFGVVRRRELEEVVRLKKNPS